MSAPHLALPGGWTYATASRPVVTAYERADKGRVLYLSWYDPDAPNGTRRGNKRKLSLGKGLRSAGGFILQDVERWAMAQAQAKSDELSGRTAVRKSDGESKPPAGLTLGETLAVVTDLDVGLYPSDSPHRRETLRALSYAVLVWGRTTLWAEITKASLQRLWRRRIADLRAAKAREATGVVNGHRGAVVTVARVLTIAQWLRDRDTIPATACVPPSDWREQLDADWRREETHDPEPRRPRYTLEETRRFLSASEGVDPRFTLMVGLGAELRLGQVARAMRSDLALDASTHGSFRTRRRGHKGGAVVHLTAGQRRLVDHMLEVGYLHELEARYRQDATDYPLFPAGQLKGSRVGKGDGSKSNIVTPARGYATVGQLDRSRAGQKRPTIDRTAVRKWFAATERRAEIPHVDGRGWYALRRAGIDFAKRRKASADAQRELGGWEDNQMPDTIYADPELEEARDEARDVRADLRGEGKEGEPTER